MPVWGVVISRFRSGLIVRVGGGFPAGFPVPGHSGGPRDAAVGVRFHGPRPRPGLGGAPPPSGRCLCG